MGISPERGRFISLPLSMCLTWYLNRRFTFQNKDPRKITQMFKYCFFVLVSLLLNYYVFLLIFKYLENNTLSFLIAISGGSICAMIFNYLFSKYLIFKI